MAARRVSHPVCTLTKALVVAGILALWVTPSAKAFNIFWSELSEPYMGGASTIAAANLDGTGVNESFIMGGTATAGVVVDGNYIYWANYATSTVAQGL